MPVWVPELVPVLVPVPVPAPVPELVPGAVDGVRVAAKVKGLLSVSAAKSSRPPSGAVARASTEPEPAVKLM